MVVKSGMRDCKHCSSGRATIVPSRFQITKDEEECSDYFRFLKFVMVVESLVTILYPLCLTDEWQQKAHLTVFIRLQDGNHGWQAPEGFLGIEDEAGYGQFPLCFSSTHIQTNNLPASFAPILLRLRQTKRWSTSLLTFPPLWLIPFFVHTKIGAKIGSTHGGTVITLTYLP
ncbi:hypothetical protein BDN67DRAFT_76686 [Paxillus ammoniavirescens]|nr:hypothetical protein BDN67DRAFT_76686 [Paxillus ammoniavirescens]